MGWRWLTAVPSPLSPRSHPAQRRWSRALAWRAALPQAAPAVPRRPRIGRAAHRQANRSQGVVVLKRTLVHRVICIHLRPQLMRTAAKDETAAERVTLSGAHPFTLYRPFNITDQVSRRYSIYVKVRVKIIGADPHSPCPGYEW
jgi:hypothetical protein